MNQTLGDIIKTARKNAGLSQQKLATLCGISRQSIILIERGEIKQPLFTTLVELSDHLKVDLDTLLQKAGYIFTSEKDVMSLGDLIKFTRLNAAITQEELASKCGICRSRLSDIETGKYKKPKLSTLENLSKNLNLDLDVLKQKAGYNNP